MISESLSRRSSAVNGLRMKPLAGERRAVFELPRDQIGVSGGEYDRDVTQEFVVPHHLHQLKPIDRRHVDVAEHGILDTRAV